MQRVCGPRCAIRLGKAKKAADKVALKARKAELQTIPELIKLTQATFNKWVRTRDEADPCISCGKPPGDLTQMHAGRDAGHYRSTGAAAHLRFHEDNCHAQCVRCNQWGSGMVVDYRIGLIKKIGLDRVEALEADNEPRKWTREELREIRAKYQTLTKQLKKEAA